MQTSVPKTDVYPAASSLSKMQPSGIQSDVSLDDRHLGLCRANGLIACSCVIRTQQREGWEGWTKQGKESFRALI